MAEVVHDHELQTLLELGAVRQRKGEQSHLEISLLRRGTVAEADLSEEQHRLDWLNRQMNGRPPEVFLEEQPDVARAVLGDVERYAEVHFHWLQDFGDVLPQRYINVPVQDMLDDIKRAGHSTEYERIYRISEGERLSTRFLDAMISHPDIRVGAYTAIYHRLDAEQQQVFSDRIQGMHRHGALIDRAVRAQDARNAMSGPKQVPGNRPHDAFKTSRLV